MSEPEPLPENLGVDAHGIVDISQPDCRGCKHLLAVRGVCRRFPPVFKPATPVPSPDGKGMVMQSGGWSFPPAVFRCGEWAKD